MEVSLLFTQVTYRDDVGPLILGVSGNVHENFWSQYDAEHAYTLVYTMGAVCCCGDGHPWTPAVPPPAAFLQAL